MVRVGVVAAMCMVIGIVAYFGIEKKEGPQYRIGVVAPYAHQSIDEMIRGFRHTVQGDVEGPVDVEVRFAHGDELLQRGRAGHQTQ